MPETLHNNGDGTFTWTGSDGRQWTLSGGPIEPRAVPQPKRHQHTEAELALLCTNCGHRYGRHKVDGSGCSECDEHEPEHARCPGWTYLPVPPRS